MFYLNKIALIILNPVIVGIVGIAISFVFAYKGRKKSVFFLAATVGWFYVWSCGLAQKLMNIAFGFDRYPVVAVETLPQADAIIDLGGGTSVNTNIFPYVEITSTSDRAAHCARIWKAKKAAIIVPSGIGIEHTDNVLLQEFGVPQSSIICETSARNTEENALYTNELLKEYFKIQSDSRVRLKVLLVTSSSHMRRSMMIFKKCAPDLECIPVPCDFGDVFYRTKLSGKLFLPSWCALAKNMVVYKECLGLAGYWLRGFGF